MATFSLCVVDLQIQVCLDLLPSSVITHLPICYNSTIGQKSMCTSTICIGRGLSLCSISCKSVPISVFASARCILSCSLCNPTSNAVVSLFPAICVSRGSEGLIAQISLFPGQWRDLSVLLLVSGVVTTSLHITRSPSTAVLFNSSNWTRPCSFDCGE